MTGHRTIGIENNIYKNICPYKKNLFIVHFKIQQTEQQKNQSTLL
jgi:hypothetical protein